MDWKHRNTDYVADYVLSHAGPGDVVLLHDIHPTTAAAVPRILDGLMKKGFTFVTVSEMLKIDLELAAHNDLPWLKKAEEIFPGLIKTSRTATKQ